MPAEVNNVASDGTSVAYQILTKSFTNENITKYDEIVLNDAKYPELSYVVNTWNNNERSRNGVPSGGSPNSQSLTSTSTLEIARNDGKIFSLCETITYYDNNKAYEKNRLGKVWDARTGEVLELSEIFNDGKYDTFLDKVNKKLESSKYDVLKNLSSDDLLDICEWYMTNVGITLVFNASDIDSDEDSISINGVTIPLTYADSGSGVNKLLKQNYKK